jgi:hypothetical protein
MKQAGGAGPVAKPGLNALSKPSTATWRHYRRSNPTAFTSRRCRAVPPLRRHPLARYYEHRCSAPECARCPVGWGKGRAEYLKRHHPELAEDYAVRLRALRGESQERAGRAGRLGRKSQERPPVLATSSIPHLAIVPAGVWPRIRLRSWGGGPLAGASRPGPTVSGPAGRGLNGLGTSVVPLRL